MYSKLSNLSPLSNFTAVFRWVGFDLVLGFTLHCDSLEYSSAFTLVSSDQVSWTVD